MSYTITQNLLTINKYSRPAIKINTIKGIVVHYTASPMGTAIANRNYFENLKNQTTRYASAHYIVGLQGEIIQCVPENEICYHVGATTYKTTKLGTYPNNCTIGVEMCNIDTTGNFSTDTYNMSVELCANLLKKYNLTIDGLFRHYDVTGKACPLLFVNNESKWLEFKSKVAEKLNGTNEVASTVKLGYEKIRFGGHTDVHIYRSKIAPELVLGVRDKRETLPIIVSKYSNTLAAINGQLFAYDNSENDGYGLIITRDGNTSLANAGFYQGGSPNFIEMIAYKDGSIAIEQSSTDVARLVNIQKNAYWGCGTSYALKIKGSDSMLNWTKFPHYTNYTNRTIIGKDTKNDIWYLIVADGGNSTDKGLRAVDEVALCNQLLITDACNLDGGGSSDLWLNGKGIVTGNYIAERAIGSAFIIRS